MAEHYALIVDEDASFRDRLARLLALVGIELIQASGEDELISLLGRRRPVVVVLAVDLLDKEGFFLFSRVKRVQRNVPVVMTTSTVPRADLKMHEKLRVHADHYIAKTELSDAELFDAVAAVAGQERAFADVAGVGDAEDEREEKAAPSQDTDPIEESSPPPDLDAKLVERLDEETVGILAEIDAESTVIVDSISAEKGELSPERLAELEADVERLAAELEHARRDARSSPFSSEFLSLREVASGKDKEIQELARSIARRDGQVLVVKRKLTELATRLVEAQTERDEKRKAASALEELLEASRVNAEQVSNKAESDRGEHEREIAALALRLADTQKGRDKIREEAAELKGRLESSGTSLERLTEKAEEIRARHEQELEELTERLASSEGDVEKERNEATESKDELASSRAELDRLKEELEKVRGEHEQEIEELTERLASSEKDVEKERNEATESKDELASSRAELDRLKEESDKVRGQHEQEIKELTERFASSEKAVEKDRNEATESKEALASARAELEQLNEESAKVRGKHEQEIEEITARLVTAERERGEAAKLEGQIEELHERLERLNDRAEGAQERHEQETIKFENTLSEERQQAASTRQELETQLTEQRTKNKRALEELEKKLLEERATTTSELEKKYAAQSDQVVDEWKRSLADAKDAHEKELSTLRSNLAAMERAETELRDNLKRVSEESTAELEACEQRYHGKNSSLEEKHDAERAELEDKLASTLESKEQMLEELTVKIQRARKNLEVERRDSHKTQERYENELSSLRETQTKNLELAEQDKMTALAELSSKSNEARTKALELERARLQDEADEVQKRHEEEVAALEERQRAELREGDAAHESVLAQKDRDLDQMSARHGEELADARREHEKALAELSRESEEAQTKAFELERGRLQVTADEVQKKHEEEVTALEERRRTELADKDAVHKFALAQKARVLEQVSAKHREELEAERDEARSALDDIRAQLAENQNKYQTERRKLEQIIETRMSEHEEERQSKIVSIEKVEKLDKLEKLERESSAKVKRLSAALAREKQESRFTRHAARIHNAMQERHKREISELDSRHADDAIQAEQTWTAKLEHLAKTLSQKAEAAAADQERKWSAKLEMMRREHETSDAALRKEPDQKLAVSGHRYEDASREIAELKTRLEALSKELTKARKEVGLRDELIAATVRKTKLRQAADPSKK